jgi:hypothetical protein
MKVNYRNNFWDLVWFSFYQFPRMRTNQIVFVLFFGVVGYTAVDVLSHTALSPAGKVVISVIALLAILLVMITINFIHLVFLQLFSSHQRLLVSQDNKLTLSETSILSESGIGRSEIKWSGIKKIKQSKRYILLYISDQAALIVPKRSFTNAEEVDTFYAYSLQQMKKAENG